MVVTTGARSTLVTVHVKPVLALSVPAVAVTVTLCAPALVYDSVPLITPVAVLIVSPDGSPVALNAIGSPSGSFATTGRLIAAFSALVWSAIAVTTGARSTLVTAQVKLALALSVPAVAVTVTLCAPALAYDSVPLMRPVDGAMLRPGGKPVALKVTASPSGSFAVTARLIAAFSALV